MNAPKIKSSRLFSFLAFMAGVTLMMLEMSAFRATVPYFGSSLYVWGNIIGTIMITMSLGYYFGGKIADKKPELKTFMVLLLATGAFAVLIPSLAKIFGAVWPNLSKNPSLSSFFFMTLLYGPPVFMIGAIPPFLTRLKNMAVETTGRAAGSIYSFEAAGSVFGTFLASFGTLPFWGTKETIYLAGLLMLILGLGGLVWSNKKQKTI